jgi:hypothetical protein
MSLVGACPDRNEDRRPRPATPEALARTFQGARSDRVAELLETLASLGQARRLEDGRYAGRWAD